MLRLLFYSASYWWNGHRMKTDRIIQLHQLLINRDPSTKLFNWFLIIICRYRWNSMIIRCIKNIIRLHIVLKLQLFSTISKYTDWPLSKNMKSSRSQETSNFYCRKLHQPCINSCFVDFSKSCEHTHYTFQRQIDTKGWV